MIEMDIKVDVINATRHLKKVQKKQIPFALMMAINTMAFDARKETMKQLPKKLDRPTPFTVKSIRVRKAKKQSNWKDTEAVVFFIPPAWDYLKYQIKGGVRNAEGNKIPVPGRGADLNKYGNIKGKRGGLAKKKNEIIKTIRGKSGVWILPGKKKGARGIQAKAIFKGSVKYTVKFQWYKIVQGIVRSKFKKHLVNALKKALRTAR